MRTQTKSLNPREFIYTGSQLLIGSMVLMRLREFRRLWRASELELESVRQGKLRRLLEHASQHVPYYQGLLRERNVRSLEELPILNKETVRRQFGELMSRQVAAQYRSKRRGRIYNFKEVNTGGTTGQPATVIHDARFRDYGRAARLFAQQLCGFPFGTPYLRLWGSMADLHRLQESRINRLASWLAGETLVNGFRMGPQQMETCLALIRRLGVRHLMAYVDCAVELARFARQQPQPAAHLHSVMACAGTVTQQARRLIEETFGCKLHNFYGSRDCPAMACECSNGRIHVFANHVWIEIVDEEGRPLGPGESGRILVTLLENYSFPLIRYEIGDIGAWAEGGCPCGSHFPVLDRIEGRIVERLRTADGSYVSPLLPVHLLGVVHNPGWIRRFQFVQRTVQDFELRLELFEDISHERLASWAESLHQELQTVFGAGCRLSIKREVEILPTPSGKYLLVVNQTGL